MKDMITTSNTKINLKKDGVKDVTIDDPIHGKVTVQVSTRKSEMISTKTVRPKTRLEGKTKKNYYGQLSTNQFKSFPETPKDRKIRETKLEIAANKKRLADGVPPVILKKGTRTK